MRKWVDKTKPNPPAKAHVAVIGAGLAGLTAAYKLAKEGFRVTVFEANPDRVGGRVFTNYDSFSPQDQFCEMGGEFIDSTHHEIIDLAHELKLDVQDISKKRTGEDMFYEDGKLYAQRDFMNNDVRKSAYEKLARYIGRDRRRAKQNKKFAEWLDNMSMDQYLSHAQIETGTPNWVIDCIKVSYKGHFGTELAEQSAMLLVNQIGTRLKPPFEMFGYNQDESRRIKGGNSKLIEALTEKLTALDVKIRTGHIMDKLDYRTDRGNPKVYVEFHQGGHKKTLHFDYVISAIPFTKLRSVQGLEALRDNGVLSEEKFKAIKELGYGNITKIMLGIEGRPWEGNPRFKKESNGSFRTDDPWLQNAWITSFGQRNSAERNILSVLVAGNEARQPVEVIARHCKSAAAKFFGKPEQELFNHRHALHRWPEDQFIRGSYSVMKPGQYTTLRHITGTPEINGQLGFVGEHTDPDDYGYMNGAVKSALREAERIQTHVQTLKSKRAIGVTESKEASR